MVWGESLGSAPAPLHEHIKTEHAFKQVVYGKDGENTTFIPRNYELQPIYHVGLQKRQLDDANLLVSQQHHRLDSQRNTMTAMNQTIQSNIATINDLTTKLHNAQSELQQLRQTIELKKTSIDIGDTILSLPSRKN